MKNSAGIPGYSRSAIKGFQVKIGVFLELNDPRGSGVPSPLGFEPTYFFAGATKRRSMSASGSVSWPQLRSMTRALPLGVTQMT